MLRSDGRFAALEDVLVDFVNAKPRAIDKRRGGERRRNNVIPLSDYLERRRGEAARQAGVSHHSQDMDGELSCVVTHAVIDQDIKQSPWPETTPGRSPSARTGTHGRTPRTNTSP